MCSGQKHALRTFQAARVLTAGSVVAMDCEWRPHTDHVALLQLATGDTVFLLDLLQAQLAPALTALVAELEVAEAP